ncbi:MAG: metallophosphoesterase [Lachnospiraceae bacterium]
MLTVIIGIIVLIILVLIPVMLIDGHRFVITEYTITSHKLVKDADFIVLADLHNKSYGKQNNRLLAAIQKIHPDGILVAGDLITSTAGEDYTPALHLIQRLSKDYPIYYGNGNHEQKIRLFPQTYGTMGERYQAGLKECGVIPMINEQVALPRYNITICGAEIAGTYYRHFKQRPMEDTYLEQLLGAANKEQYQILIAHNPDYYEEYVKWGADLILSGHIHGGIMRLPWLGGVLSPALRLFPRYDGGRFDTGSSTMIVSRGLGMHTIPIRIFNPGELVVLHLRTEGKVL